MHPQLIIENTLTHPHTFHRSTNKTNKNEGLISLMGEGGRRRNGDRFLDKKERGMRSQLRRGEDRCKFPEKKLVIFCNQAAEEKKLIN